MESTRYFFLPLNLWNNDGYALGMRTDIVKIQIPKFFYYGEISRISLRHYEEEVLTQLLQQIKNPNCELHDIISKIRKTKMPGALFSNLDDSWSDEKIVQTMVYGIDGKYSILDVNWIVNRVTYDVGKDIVLIEAFSR